VSYVSLRKICQTSISKMTNEGVKKIGTHSGVFHCDEVVACNLLKRLPAYRDAEIIRFVYNIIYVINTTVLSCLLNGGLHCLAPILSIYVCEWTSVHVAIFEVIKYQRFILLFLEDRKKFHLCLWQILPSCFIFLF